MKKLFQKRPKTQKNNQSEQEIKEIEDVLFNRAGRYLALRERSEKEIQNYLQKKVERYYLPDEQQTQVVSAVVNRLKELDLLNDKRFIEWWVDQRSYFKPRGTYLLRQELQQKGANKDEVSFYFEDNQLDELTLAKNALLKKSKSLQLLQSVQLEKKALAFLMRRGFSFVIAKKAFEEWREKRYNETQL